ncbi:MAG: hypothetical protein K6E17_06840 [Clostridiales bacterium]|nr:hypothetical protein [Clostridiales bacterium]
MRKLTAMILALVMAVCALSFAAAEDDQDRYWRESGREYLHNMWYYGRGTKLTADERSEFFRNNAVVMDYVDQGMNGSFIIYSSGDFYGHVSDSYGADAAMSDFSGRFTEVWRLTPYVYALETNYIAWMADDYPEAMQNTMLLTLPGARTGTDGALKYEIQQIAAFFGLNEYDPLPCYFITAFDSAPLWFSGVKSGYTVPDGGESWNQGNTGGSVSYDLYGLTIDKLATRKGPGTQYDGGGTYSVKGQYIKVLTRAYDKRNRIWWVKCEIPYRNEIRVLWTGYKRFDASTIPLETIPIDPEY